LSNKNNFDAILHLINKLYNDRIHSNEYLQEIAQNTLPLSMLPSANSDNGNGGNNGDLLNMDNENLLNVDNQQQNVIVDDPYADMPPLMDANEDNQQIVNAPTMDLDVDNPPANTCKY
jgi:hypothetical protein